MTLITVLEQIMNDVLIHFETEWMVPNHGNGDSFVKLCQNYRCQIFCFLENTIFVFWNRLCICKTQILLPNTFRYIKK